MRLKFPAIILAGAALSLVFTLPPSPAKSQSGISNDRARTAAPRSRLTVRPRSYLDPGPEVMPGSQSYTNYLFLNSTPGDSLGPFIDRKRSYPDPWHFENTTGWR